MSMRNKWCGLREATRGARFVLSSPERERAIAWRGGSTLCLYDLGGGLLDTFSVKVEMGAAGVREYARKLLGGVGVEDVK